MTYFGNWMCVLESDLQRTYTPDRTVEYSREEADDAPIEPDNSAPFGYWQSSHANAQFQGNLFWYIL